MESLYTKYRPQTFADVVGQQHVVSTLEHAVLEGRTSHAYLFCGPRGTGKTTMARLLAKALMCERGAGHLPDGSCEQCRLIASGDHPDVYELDAASRTGVDNVREEIISRVSYAPVRGGYKVYIIDEVHMLTTAAFNALLKTLEEPPEHTLFVLCTTDPQKIPETILSRVQRFDFHAIGNDDIKAHLTRVCDEEGFSYDVAAIELVVRHARGGMRDALSTLEQLSVFGSGKISVEAARDLLGEVSGSQLASVACAMAERNVPSLFGTVADLVDAGRDLLQFSRELAAHLRDVYVVSAVGATPGVVDADEEGLRQLKDEALAFGSVDRVAHALDCVSAASSEMRTATNQRLVLEVALTRIARPKSDLTLESLADRISRLEHQLVSLRASGVPTPRESVRPATASSRPGIEPAPLPKPHPVPATQPKPVASPGPAPETPAVPPAPAAASPAATDSAPAPAAPGVRGAITDAGELQRKWRQVVDGLVRTNPPRGSLLMASTPVSDDGSHLLINLPKGSAFACKMLERPDVRDVVERAVSAVFGERSLTYAESSLRGADIARSKREVVSALVSAPRAEPTPAPRAEPAPAPTPPPSAPAPRCAPAAGEAGAPVQEAPPYPAPWDDAPPYEEVPYDDVPAEPAPAPAPKPTAAPAPAPKPTAAPAPASEPSPTAQPDVLPDEARSIMSMLTDVFGTGVNMSVESPSDVAEDPVGLDDDDYDAQDEFVPDPEEDDDLDD